MRMADLMAFVLQCVLAGHTGPVSYVDFNPAVSTAVLSCSFDGTCRIWNITDSSAAAVVCTVLNCL
eukprot:scaffold29451_cov19-Prasinocladus_malaysianus.AAC.1